MTATATPEFHDQVISLLPKLRVQALALTRNRAGAEDLVQDAVCNALRAADSFIPRDELSSLDASHSAKPLYLQPA